MKGLAGSTMRATRRVVDWREDATYAAAEFESSRRSNIERLTIRFCKCCSGEELDGRRDEDLYADVEG